MMRFKGTGTDHVLKMLEESAVEADIHPPMTLSSAHQK